MDCEHRYQEVMGRLAGISYRCVDCEKDIDVETYDELATLRAQNANQNCGGDCDGEPAIASCKHSQCTKPPDTLESLQESLAAVTQERDELRAERDRLELELKTQTEECRKAIEIGTAYVYRANKAEAALKAVQEENERLKGETHSLRIGNQDANAVISRQAGMLADLRAQLTAAQQSAKEQHGAVAVEFFYWWHNQPGTNTEQGFDEWWAIREAAKEGSK